MVRPRFIEAVLTLAITAALVAACAPAAAALTIVSSERVEAERTFAGTGCNTTDTTTLRTRAGAFDVRVGGVAIGTVLPDVVDDLAVATLVGVETWLEPDGRWAARWTVRSGYAACDPRHSAYRYGWSTYDEPFALSWRRRVTVLLEPLTARKLLSGALRFRLRLPRLPRGVRCSRSGEREARCRLRFWRGEVLYDGSARVVLGADRRRTALRWSYTWRIAVTDQHCLELRGRPLRACRRSQTLTRRNLRL